MTDLYLGLMSGTSVDSLDIAACTFNPEIEIRATADYPFPLELRQRINQACLDEPVRLDDLMLLEQDYTRFVALSVTDFLHTHRFETNSIRAQGFHGQTLRHRPDIGASFQMANPSLLAELTDIDVIADFRRRDLAAGGEGAPLVPAFHQHLVSQLPHPLGVLNLGGIANLSLFSESSETLGFDTGPANTLMDQWIATHRGLQFDQNGDWAASGRINEILLSDLLSEPYFARPAPKSTGRELFNMAWLQSRLLNYPDIPAEDVQRTLLELTTTSICRSIKEPLRQLIVCGGGAENRLLMRRLQDGMPDTQVSSSDRLGWPASHIEAVAFAWLAMRHVEQLSGNLPSATGARGTRVLGARYPA